MAASFPIACLSGFVVSRVQSVDHFVCIGVQISRPPNHQRGAFLPLLCRLPARYLSGLPSWHCVRFPACHASCPLLPTCHYLHHHTLASIETMHVSCKLSLDLITMLPSTSTTGHAVLLRSCQALWSSVPVLAFPAPKPSELVCVAPQI